MRGENGATCLIKLKYKGTPPHAWGKPGTKDFTTSSNRYTPTCVGKTSTSQASGWNSAGTPPHAWGKLLCSAAGLPMPRYTPTCVGKTHLTAHCNPPETVHPHMRGENGLGALRVARFVGTPPHAWGKRFMKGLEMKPLRYTPTCVGKTHYQFLHCRRRQVHPHMRGENFVFSGCGRAFPGTPPHAWGKLRSKRISVRYLRYTPTCVGKTIDELGRDRITDGTPPHAWGKPDIVVIWH